MKKKYLFLLILLIGVFACNLPFGTSTVTPQIPSVIPPATSTPIPTNVIPPTPIVVSETPTAVPTIIPTVTPLGPPVFTSNTSANCRQGPSTDYPIMAGVFKDQTARILGMTTSDRVLWWFVEKDGVRCWVWSDLGSTSGLMTNIPVLAAPPVPTPSRNKIDVLFENNTESNICRMDFYVGIDQVASFKWNKGEFKNDGADAIVSLPIGEYDLIEAYNCKSKLVSSLTDIVINKDHDAYSLP